MILDNGGFLQTPAASEDDSSEQKLEALIEMICGAGEESATALLVLMATFENQPTESARKYDEALGLHSLR